MFQLLNASGQRCGGEEARVTDSDIEFVTVAEDEEARDRALAEIGLSYDQLKEQAEADAFVSERARALWDAFGELSPA